jgi:alpha-tubulin suppressor-like RCC1 family protein
MMTMTRKSLLALLLVSLVFGLLACQSAAEPIFDMTDRFELHENEAIVQVVSGGTHAIALTSSSRVFVWGDNASGQLGIGSLVSNETPQDITASLFLSEGEDVIQIGAGDSQSFALTSNGNLFVWGTNLLDAGQGNLIPKLVTSLITLNQSETITAVIISKFEGILLATTSTDRVIQIRVNRDVEDFALEILNLTPFFTLSPNETILRYYVYTNAFQAITSNGRLVSAAFDIPGVWEDDSYPFYNNTQLFTLQLREELVFVEHGYSLTYVITNNGRIFGYGLNDKGQLGIAQENYRIPPLELSYMFQMPAGESIVEIESFLNFAFAKTSLNRILTWGYSLYDFSGETPVKPSNGLPVDITSTLGLAEGETILIMTAGREEAYFLTSTNRLIYWTLH